MEWLRDNWIKVHLAVSPFGALLVTWFLLYAVGAGQWWNNRENLELAGQSVPWGGVIYGSAILFLEVLARMLWMLATRHKEIEKGREEGREEGKVEGREEGREETIQKLLERGIELPPDVLDDIRGNGQR